MSEVYDQDGSVVCKTCFDAQSLREESELMGDDTDSLNDSANALAAAASAAVVHRTSNTKRPPYLMRIVAGSIAAVVLIVGVILSGLSSHHPQVSLSLPAGSSPSAPPDSASQSTGSTVSAPNEDPNQVTWTKLIEMRRQALDHESSGDLNEAAATYAKMVKLAQDLADPSEAVKSQLASAQSALEAIKQKLAATATSSTEPKPAPASIPTQTPQIASGEASVPTPAVANSGADWEQAHTPRLKQLLKQGEARLAANDTFNAALIYQQLFEVVGPHLPEIQDADLKKQITTAAATRGKLLVAVKSSPQSIDLTAGSLLASGLEALGEKRWQAGMESLSDVRQLFDRNVKLIDRARNPNYVLALHGLAVAYLGMKQTPKAGELFDDSAPLGQAVDREPTRELVINRAVTDIIQKTKVMRAAKSLKGYLEKHPADEPDEQLLNLLGTALFVAQEHTTAKGFLEQCARIYEVQNARLEQSRSGEKRWGIEWLPSREVDKKLAERKKQLEEASKLAGQAKAAYAESQRQQNLLNSYYANGARKTSPAAAKAAEDNYENLSRAAAEAASKIQHLPWLEDVEPVLPPMPKGLAVVASADTGDGALTGSIFATPTITLHDAPAAPSDAAGTTSNPPEMTAAAAAPSPVHIPIPRHALAFAIDKNRLLTSAEVLASATEVRMENSEGQIYSAHVVAREGALALLELDANSGPIRYLNLAESFGGGPVQCAAVPQENIFGPQPSILTGQAAAPAQGDWSVSLSDHPRLAGSPLLNEQGQVIGVVTAGRDDVRTKLPAISIGEIRQFLTNQSALPTQPGTGDPLGAFEVTVQDN